MDPRSELAGRRRRLHGSSRPELDEDDDWATERDDPTFGKRPTEASSSGRPLPTDTPETPGGPPGSTDRASRKRIDRIDRDDLDRAA